MNSAATTCPRCGSRASDGRDTCAVCGSAYRRHAAGRSHDAKAHRVLPVDSQWGGKSAAGTDAAKGRHRPSPAVPLQGSDAPLVKLFGTETISGVVLHVDGPHRVRRRAGILSVVLGIVGLLLLPVFLAVSLATRVTTTVIGMLGFRGAPSKSGRTFAGDFVRQFSTAFFMAKMFGPGEEGVVRHVRIRDSSGNEHGVRVEGELLSGSISVGDDVVFTGDRRDGTLVFRSGENRRTRSRIRVTGR